MKKLFTFLVSIAIGMLLTASGFAQSPEKMSYQAVIRDANDELVTDTQVGMRISIIQDDAFGASVYVETRTATTNANGLISIQIGSNDATVIKGDFATIDWSNGPYFIKTETDPTGGTDYTISGTTQLLSVPYALHAKSADTVSGGISETDPVFSSWDKSSGISITENQISDLDHFTTTDETDPVFGSSLASEITATDTTNWNNKLDSETDPVFGSSLASKITATDTTSWNNKLDSETDPVYDTSVASGITATDTTNWNNKLDSETDPSVPSGNQTGEMQYWDGSEWVTLPPGDEGQSLNMVGGVPTWQTPGVNEVENPTTGKTWMDRNLGASRVAKTSSDVAAYGDLYQWGRGTDGHEQRNSNTTSTLSSSDTPGHGDFILPDSSPYDWRSPQNDNLWQGVNGTNNPCPDGYRLPTAAEWEAERQSWSSNDAAGAFASPLKLPVAGYRSNINGSLSDVGYSGDYWSSTVDGTDSRYPYFSSSTAYMVSSPRSYGRSVRCIKD